MTNCLPLVAMSLAWAACLGASPELYVESKRFLPLSEPNIVQLYVGLNKNDGYRSKVADFHIDFEFAHTMITSDFDCRPETGCRYENDEVVTLVYRNLHVTARRIVIFLGLAHLKPREAVDPPLDQLIAHKALLATTDNLTRNVLGLSPQSTVLEYLDHIYKYKVDTLRLQIFNYPTYRYAIFSNLPTESGKIYEEQPPKVEVFTVNAWVTLTDSNQREQRFTGRACVSNDAPDLALRVDPTNYFNLKAAICTDPEKCEKEDDLDADYDQVQFRVSYGDQNEPGRHTSVVITGEELVTVSETGVLTLRFGKLESMGSKCDLKLEHLFFTNVFISIKACTTNGKKHIALGQVRTKFFNRLGTFSAMCHVTVVVCYLLTVVYIVFSKRKLKKRVTALSYKQLSFCERLTPAKDKEEDAQVREDRTPREQLD